MRTESNRQGKQRGYNTVRVEERKRKGRNETWKEEMERKDREVRTDRKKKRFGKQRRE